MSDKQKGLSEIHETARGFVGRSIIFDQTQRQRSRVRFELCCGDTKPEFNKYPIWRYCVGYGDEVVRALERAIKGSHVKVWGWLSCEGVKDSEGNLVEENGTLRKRETMVMYKAELLAVDSVDRQLALITNSN